MALVGLGAYERKNKNHHAGVQDIISLKSVPPGDEAAYCMNNEC